VRPISTKLGRKQSYGIEIKTCSQKGPRKGQNKKSLIHLQIFNLRNAFIFGMEHPWASRLKIIK